MRMRRKTCARLAPAATIEPPDDGLLRALLVKLFIDRQLVVDIAVIDALAGESPAATQSATEAS